MTHIMKTNQTLSAHLKRTVILFAAAFIFTGNLYAQVVGSVESGQSVNQVCAPASYDITYKFTFISPANPSADIDILFKTYNYDRTASHQQLNIDDATIKTEGAPFFRKYIEETYTTNLPIDGDCEYSVDILLYYEGAYIGTGYQLQYISNWHIDDEGDGNINVAPDIEEVCEGDSLIDFTFQDASDFACVDPSLQSPNTILRYVQFIYNTSHLAGDTDGIPNLTINVHGKEVKLTDINGEPMPNSWTVDPTDGSTVTAYSTNSGYFEGTVDSTGYSPTTGIHNTYPISFPGITTFVGDYMEVTVRNWNFCNPWNSSQTNPNDGDARTDFGRIVIIDSPPAPSILDKEICEGGDRELEVTSAVIGEIRWYDDDLRTTIINTGTKYTQPQTADSIYEYWVSDVATLGNGCASPLTKVTLTIYATITGNTINDNSEAFCGSGNPTNIDGDPAAGGDGNVNDDYQWQIRTTGAWADIVGATGEDYDPPELPATEIFETTSYQRVISSGECSSISNVVTVTVYEIATVTDPVNTATCGNDYSNNGDASFSVSVVGAPRTIQWIRSNDAGATWDTITAGNVPNDACVYSGYNNTATLDITSADFGMNGYQYRAVVRTIAGGCEAFSGIATLTVYPVPFITAANQPDDLTVCELETADFYVTGSIDVSASIASYQWMKRPAGSWVPIDGTETDGTFTDYDTDNLTILLPEEALDAYRLRVVITSDDGCDVLSDRADLSINPLADISTQPLATKACVGLNASFTVAIDGTPAAAGYQWETDQGTGTWIDATGGIYSNDGTATLNLTAVVIGINGWEYRCKIETAGGCFITSDEVALTVHQNPIASIDPVASELCTGEFIDLDGNGAGGTGALVHAWTGDDGNLDDDGVIDPRFTAPIIVGPAVPYNMIYTVTDSEGCIATDAVSVVVNPTVTVNVLPATAEICAGVTVSLNGNPGGGTLPIGSVWTGTGAGDITAGAGTPDITYTAPAIGGVYTLIYTATDSKLCNATQTVNITVNENPTANITRDGNAELCYDEVVNLHGNPGGGDANYAHAWTGDVATVVLTNEKDPTFTAPSELTQQVKEVFYTVTDGNGCAAIDSLEIIVNPEVKTAVLSGDIAVCSGFDADLVVDIVGGTGTYTVVLDDSDPAININQGGYVSGADIVTGPNTLGSNTFTINSVIDSKNCRATSETGSATIIVGSTPTDADLFGGKEICTLESTPLQVIVNGGAPPYLVEFTAASSQGNEVDYISGDDITPDVLNPGTNTFQILKITDACGAFIETPNVGTSEQIILNPRPTLTPVNIDPVICNDANTDINISSDITNTIYKWTVSYPGTTSWVVTKLPVADSIFETADPENIAQNLAHTMTSTVSVDYDIQAFGPAPTRCAGGTGTETVIVEPTPAAGITNSTQTICDTDAITNMVISSLKTHNGTPTFDMTVTATTGVLGALNELLGTPLAPQTGHAYPFTISGEIGNPTTAPIVVEYSVLPLLSGGCANGLPETATLTINPAPQVNLPGDQEICVGDNSTLVTFATNNTVGVTTYAWTNTNTAIGLGAGATSATIPAFTATNTGTTPISGDIVITPTFTNGGESCTGNPQTFTITVNPAPQVDLPNDQLICVGDNSTLVTFATDNSGGTTTYAWTNDNTAIGLGAGATSATIPAFTTTNTGLTPISGDIVITPTFTNGTVSQIGRAHV